MDSVSSNSHGNLDEQISQLMQCKPLNEQEVPTFFLLLLFFVFFVPSSCYVVESRDCLLILGGFGWFKSNVMDPA